MQHSIKKMKGFAMGATDGEIGKVRDFFFDDETWTIRYLVVETGSWLLGRKVLISTQSLTSINFEEETFPVSLTRDQIKNSPDIDTEKPVSRQQEMELYNHYPWQSYWGGAAAGVGMMGIGMTTPLGDAVDQSPSAQNNRETTHQQYDPHLRSIEDVKGYTIEANDGDMGDVDDFITDEHWKIQFMVIDTGKWLPGKKVLISPEWIKSINWESSAVKVGVSKDKISDSPEYKEGDPIPDSYKATLYNFYGIPM